MLDLLFLAQAELQLGGQRSMQSTELEESGIALGLIWDWMETEALADPQKLQIVKVVALGSSFDLWGVKGTRVTEINNRIEAPLSV